MYCTARLVLTSVSGHYSGQGVKLTTHLRIVLRLGMRGAVPRIVYTPAVIQQCINPLNAELNPICHLLSINKSSPYTPR